MADTKKCPRCNGVAKQSGVKAGDVGRIGAVSFAHGHPVFGLVAVGVSVAKMLMAKSYRCKQCDHEFKG